MCAAPPPIFFLMCGYVDHCGVFLPSFVATIILSNHGNHHRILLFLLTGRGNSNIFSQNDVDLEVYQMQKHVHMYIYRLVFTDVQYVIHRNLLLMLTLQQNHFKVI